MQWVYYHESGDDGFPSYSSPLYVLTATCVPEARYQEVVQNLTAFRVYADQQWGLPTHKAFCTRAFLLNKFPYWQYQISDEAKVKLLYEMCRVIAQLPLSVVNVVINKSVILKEAYPVLERSLAASMQAIETRVQPLGADERFLMVAENGRYRQLMKAVRKIPNHRYITANEAKHLGYSLAEALNDSPLLDISDTISFLIYGYMVVKLQVGELASRVAWQLDWMRIITMLDDLKPLFNLKAISKNPHGYGIVCFPE